MGAACGELVDALWVAVKETRPGLADLDTDGRFRKSEQQRILIEVLLIKFAMLDRTVALEELIGAVGGEPERKPAPRAQGPAPRSEKRRNRETAKTPTRRSHGEELAGGAADRSAPSGATLAAPTGPLEKVRTAWQEMIAGGAVLRPGQGIALRAARIVELDADGVLQVAAPAGTPGAEVLEDKVTRRRLEQELSQRLGRPIKISGPAQSEPLPPRIDQDQAREQRLERLVDGNQDLQRLVDKLDLELLE